MYRVKELAWWGGGWGDGPPPPRLVSFFSDSSRRHNLKYVPIMHFDAFSNHCYSFIFVFGFCTTVLSSPYIAHERTAPNLLLSVCSERFALCLRERHRSQNQGSLMSEEGKSDFKEQCSQLCLLLIFVYSPKLGVLLFEIVQSFFPLERTLMLGGMALLKTKSEAQRAHWQNKMWRHPFMSDISRRERSNSANAVLFGLILHFSAIFQEGTTVFCRAIL
jgi:hypothetical protein